MNTEKRRSAGVLPPFAGINTFLKLKHTRDREILTRCDFAVVGLPFDTAVTYRPGARFGPSAIREISGLLRTYNPAVGVAPLEVLSGIDYGDSPVVAGNTEKSLELIEETVSVLCDCDVIPVCLGGDHLATLPVLRALSRKHGRLGLVHFDSHSDTSTMVYGEKYNHATPFLRADEEGLIDPDRSIQVGLRGSVSDPEGIRKARDRGYTIVDAPAMLDMPPAEVTRLINDTVAGGPVYITFDIDFVDPAHAPGTGTPEIGGPDTALTLSYIRALDFSRVVGFDLVEVLPAMDVSQVTALAAANILYEMISVLATTDRA